MNKLTKEQSVIIKMYRMERSLRDYVVKERKKGKKMCFLKKNENSFEISEKEKNKYKVFFDGKNYIVQNENKERFNFERISMAILFLETEENALFMKGKV